MAGNLVTTFSAIKKNIKINPSSVQIDNYGFKLHYRFTALFLFISCILVTSQEFIGEHIRCLVHEDKKGFEKVVNTFCFFTSTFTLAEHYNDEKLGHELLPHPGVGPFQGNSTRENVIHHSYYQWIPFVLFAQGILFLFTHMLWKRLEGGKMKSFLNSLQNASYSFLEKEVTIEKKKIPTAKQRKDNISFLKNLFVKNKYVNQSWMIGLIFCEFLNIVNVILQVHATNKLLNGQFLSLGSRLINEGLESKADVLDFIFPKVTKCSFFKFGASGTIQEHDVLCVMALNVINDKIFTFLWFWYLFLFITSILSVVWRLFTILLHSRSHKFNQFAFALGSPGRINPYNDLAITNYFCYKDWLFLKYLAKNMDPLVFKELFHAFALEMENPYRSVPEEEEEAPDYPDNLLIQNEAY